MRTTIQFQPCSPSTHWLLMSPLNASRTRVSATLNRLNRTSQAVVWQENPALLLALADWQANFIRIERFYSNQCQRLGKFVKKQVSLKSLFRAGNQAGSQLVLRSALGADFYHLLVLHDQLQVLLEACYTFKLFKKRTQRIKKQRGYSKPLLQVMQRIGAASLKPRDWLSFTPDEVQQIAHYLTGDHGLELSSYQISDYLDRLEVTA